MNPQDPTTSSQDADNNATPIITEGASISTTKLAGANTASSIQGATTPSSENIIKNSLNTNQADIPVVDSTVTNAPIAENFSVQNPIIQNPTTNNIVQTNVPATNIAQANISPTQFLQENISQVNAPVANIPAQINNPDQANISQTNIPPASPQGESSFLASIIQAADATPPSVTSPINSGTAGAIPSIPPTPPPNPKKPVSPALMFKFFGSLLLVSVIVFGSFLSYVVFNPDQAAFFQTIFNINPNDIAQLLRSMINVSFGITTGILAIAWVIVLFRAIWTPKDQKRKKLFNWIIAILTGIVLFGIIGFWAYLFSVINATDYNNIGGRVLIYDNDLYVNSNTRDIAQIRAEDMTNIIGPITLRFDIRQNAAQVERRNAIKIDSYEVNFDGANCTGDTSILRGTDPLSEVGMVCVFDTIKNYNIRGSYTFIDKTTGESAQIQLPLDPISIKGLMKITSAVNKDGKNVITYDASPLMSLGTPRFYDASKGTILGESTVLSETPTATPFLIGLKVFSETSGYDRRFILQEIGNNGVEGEISVRQNPTNTYEYIFSLSGAAINENNITSVEWQATSNNANNIRMCNSARISCTYTFSSYGEWTINAKVSFITGESITLTRTLRLEAPIEIDRHVRVNDKNGIQLNPTNTYDATTKSFIIKNITVPDSITLDARDVLPKNPGYTLSSVDWDITEGGKTETRLGDRITFDVNKTARYVIVVHYTFTRTIQTGQADTDTQHAQDIVILDLERKSLSALMKITQTSDYVPAKVTVDGSQSRSEYSEIIKFIYDFGEGRPPAQGDAIQTYEYNTAGSKTITLTIVDANGEETSTKQTVVFKDTPNTIGFTTSLSPGFVGVNVDFIANQSSGQIEEYIWNFGDNTAVGRGYDVTHQYAKTGTYNVTLTVRYVDGTEKTTSAPFIVEKSMDDY